MTELSTQNTGRASKLGINKSGIKQKIAGVAATSILLTTLACGQVNEQNIKETPSSELGTLATPESEVPFYVLSDMKTKEIIRKNNIKENDIAQLTGNIDGNLQGIFDQTDEMCTEMNLSPADTAKFMNMAMDVFFANIDNIDSAKITDPDDYVIWEKIYKATVDKIRNEITKSQNQDLGK